MKGFAALPALIIAALLSLAAATIAHDALRLMRRHSVWKASFERFEEAAETLPPLNRALRDRTLSGAEILPTPNLPGAPGLILSCATRAPLHPASYSAVFSLIRTCPWVGAQEILPRHRRALSPRSLRSATTCVAGTLPAESAIDGNLSASVLSIHASSFGVSGFLEADSLDLAGNDTVIIAGGDLSIGSIRRAPPESRLHIVSVSGTLAIGANPARVEIFTRTKLGATVPAGTIVTGSSPLLRPCAILGFVDG